MNDIKTIIDWAIDVNLQIWNVMKHLGSYWYVWVAVIFAFPWFSRLIGALKGDR